MHDVTRRAGLRAILRCAVAGLLGTQKSTSALIDTEGIGEGERWIMASVARRFMEQYAVPGLSVAIARQGRLVYKEAFGFANTQTNEKLTTSHLFRIASVTKPITSVAIFRLIEQGRLHLQDRIFGNSALLETTYGTTPYGKYVQDITVEHLLTHTCGGWQNNASDPMFRFPQMNHQQLIGWTLDHLPLAHTPGEHWAYSNFGYCLLGRVIEKVTGKAYRDFVREVVLSPSGVSDMKIAGNTAQQRAPREVIYYDQDDEDPYNMNLERMDSHGGWLATPADLVDFATHVDGFSTTPSILKRATIQEMISPSRANPAYAKGWMINSAGNWWHNGSLPGSTTIMVRTASGFCWAALTNTRRQPYDEIGLALDNMVWDMVRRVSAWRP
jgi:CubicO group peptidase (beta-lactamase class C family)